MGEISKADFTLGCLPAEGLNAAWLCFVSANIYHGFSAAWGVIGKPLVATVLNKVIHSRDWLSFSIVRAVVTRREDRTWHYFWGKNRYSSLPDVLWCRSLSCLAEGTREVPELVALMTSPQRIFQLLFEGLFGAYQGLKVDTTFP